jgi:hypothetical protein
MRIHRLKFEERESTHAKQPLNVQIIPMMKWIGFGGGYERQDKTWWPWKAMREIDGHHRQASAALFNQEEAAIRLPAQMPILLSTSEKIDKLLCVVVEKSWLNKML